MTTTAPGLFDYDDYRVFLKDSFDFKKQQQPRWSYGLWASKLGVGSAGVLSNILNGRRSPGKAVSLQLMEYFKFSELERAYFEGLVQVRKKAANTQEQQEIVRKLKARYIQNYYEIDNLSFKIISHWYCTAIREMTHLKDFNENADWIQKRLMNPVSITAIEEARENLAKLQLLERDTKGRLRNSPRWINTQTDRQSEAIRDYHKQMIQLALESLNSTPIEKRDVTGITFNVRIKDIPNIKADIQNFRKALCSNYEAEPGEQTYQLNVQFFPLTKEST